MKNLAIVTLWVGITILTAPATIAADLALKAGLNLVSLTKVPASGLTSYGLLDVFGPNLLAVSRINASLQHVETTTFQDGAAGAEFPMSIDQAYFVEMAADSDIELSGIQTSITVDLEAGVNLIGLNPVSSSFHAFDLLKLIGPPGTVASVQRFDKKSGRYLTAMQTTEQLAGDNFKIEVGEGYLVSVLQSVSGIKAPVGFILRASENFQITREVLSNGGGASQSDNFNLQSVIGQASPVGVTASSSFQLKGGFLTVPTAP